MSASHDGNRKLQDRFDTRRLADRIEERIVRDRIDDDDRAFIEARDMFFLATADEDGQPQCSYKGGDPGFVRVLDERKIAFPSYDGNGIDPLLAAYPEAQLIVRVRATEVFPNCPRYIHEYRLVRHSRFVPKAECETPVPRWKQSDWASVAGSERSFDRARRPPGERPGQRSLARGVLEGVAPTANRTRSGGRGRPTTRPRRRVRRAPA